MTSKLLAKMAGFDFFHFILSNQLNQNSRSKLLTMTVFALYTSQWKTMQIAIALKKYGGAKPENIPRFT